MTAADPRSNAPAGNGPPDATLCATAAVALRWWPAGTADPVQLEADCTAGLRAMEACLESDGARQAGAAQARLEAKIDLVLVALDRLGEAGWQQAGNGGRAHFLPCEAVLRPDSVEWCEPMPTPPDGTPVILEWRAAPGHPVSARLCATLARHPAGGDPRIGTRVVATLAPMAPPLRDAYERCVFILHRQAVRRASAGSGTD
ncbi:MAG: hypothetical protein ACK515_11830 [bacterium]|jgi:hypothetical protein|nr:hypothetical protein [Betaproteobacteria bacterium]